MGIHADSFTVERHLAEELGSITVARQVVRDALRDWDYAGQHEDVLLVVSELVTNALMHGAGAPVLRMTKKATHLRIEVGDSSEEAPRAREPGPADGWGMHVIGRLSSRWGISHRDGGKVIWCELASPLAPLAPEPGCLRA